MTKTHRLISQGMPATQSSLCAFSRGATLSEDAAGALDGAPDGDPKFHTGFEDAPWWQADLLRSQPVCAITLHNVSHSIADRLQNFTLEISPDGQAWTRLVEKSDNQPVGQMFHWQGAAQGRFVRITAAGPCFLHLAQVEIFSDGGVSLYPISAVTPDTLQNLDGDVTMVLTSCNRQDLLAETLASFRKFNSYGGVREILVVEDGDADPSEICRTYGARLIHIRPNRGQVHAIDVGYAHVQTPYIFHCEDDWEFYRPGFIERSIDILRADPSCVTVWLRAWSDTNAHPLSFRATDGSFGVLAQHFLGHWHGFTWNPGLRRKSDYERVGPFSKIFNLDDDILEHHASVKYHALGYRGVILDEPGYIRHLGYGRSTWHFPAPEGS